MQALVVAVDRGRYRCLVETGRKKQPQIAVTAMRARELGRKGVVVGDQVGIVGDVSGKPDALARVVRVEPRTSILRRTADDTEDVERVIVSNADQLVMVTALANPEPRTGMIDRCLVAAHDAGMDPLLVLTKADLAPPETLMSIYGPIGVPYLVTRRGDDLTDLRAALKDRMSVMVGHSGVGKSTLVNALVPNADRAVGHVNVVTGRGRHTSSSAIALELPDGGWIIDTPGVRSFGLAHIPPEDLILGFTDLLEGSAECPPMCNHLDATCALDAWVAADHATPERLESFRRLLTNREEDTETPQTA